MTSSNCSSVRMRCERTSLLCRVGCRRATKRGQVKCSFVSITICFNRVYCEGGRYLYSGGETVYCCGFLVCRYFFRFLNLIIAVVFSRKSVG